MDREIKVLSGFVRDQHDPPYSKVKALKNLYLSNIMVLEACWNISQGESEPTEALRPLVRRVYEQFIEAIAADPNAEYATFSEAWSERNI